MTTYRRVIKRALLAASTAVGALSLIAPAHAYRHGSVFIAAPTAIVGPSPQATAVPASATPMPAGRTCYAGVYVCRSPRLLPAGSDCACPGLGAPSYGTVHP